MGVDEVETGEQGAPRRGAGSWVALPGFVAVTFLAAVLGILFPPGAWYAQLAKPSWNPPAWLFGPVWTALYLAMAVAAWRVWRCRPATRALTVYWIQLALNAAWSPLFFGLQQPGLAVLEILGLWAAIALTVRAFWPVDRLAAALLGPYLAWVSFAAVLNFALWRLNS